jgi:hypothetical protein
MKKKPYKFKQIFDETYTKKGGYKGKEKKVFKFTWDYCALCQTMFVRCPKCGNNCCNASFGHTKNGLPTNEWEGKGVISCDVCNLAYQFQHLAWETKKAPKPTAKQLKDAEKQRNQPNWPFGF